MIQGCQEHAGINLKNKELKKSHLLPGSYTNLKKGWVALRIAKKSAAKPEILLNHFVILVWNEPSPLSPVPQK